MSVEMAGHTRKGRVKGHIEMKLLKVTTKNRS